MDYSKLIIPLLTQHQITNAAESFRNKYHANKPSPLNILDIVEFDLKIQIIPIPKLEFLCNSSAFITSSWDMLYIDQRQYENESFDKRTNFSVAHEIGHLVLHKQFYESLHIRNFVDFYKFFNGCPPQIYKLLENQANPFAGKLLVPGEELRTAIAELTNKKVKPDEILKTLSDRFAVTNDAIIWRIIYEKIDINLIKEGIDPGHF